MRVAAGLLVGLLLAAGAAAQEATPRERFGEWTAYCEPGGAGSCSVNAFIHRDDPLGFLDWRLRVAVPGFFAGPAMSIVAVRHHVAPDSDIALTVDGGEPVAFAPGDGWRALTAPNDYHLLDDGRVQSLLEAMRGGKRVGFFYRDVEGTPRSERMPLEGFGEAMDFVRSVQARMLPAFAAGTAHTWARDIHDLLPLLQPCLGRAPAQPAVVAEAVPEDGRRLLVRVIADGGGRFECVVERDAAQVRDFAPAMDWPMSSLAGPWYLPGRRPPPEDACEGRVRLVDRADRPAGWLIYGC